jgi:hypothetical protein
MFNKTICSRDEDPTNISYYSKDLLASIRDGARRFSVTDFVWEEIMGISLNPLKNYVFALYLMFVIEDVTDQDYPKNV